MAWRWPGPRLGGRRAAIFALAATLGAMAPVAPSINGAAGGWAVANAVYAGSSRGDAGAAGGAGYRGGGAGGGGDAKPGGGAGPGGGAAGAAPGDPEGAPGSGAAGAAGAADGARGARGLGAGSGGGDRDPSPFGPSSTNPVQPPVIEQPRRDQHAVPSGLTQVGDDLSPAEEADLIAGKWR